MDERPLTEEAGVTSVSKRRELPPRTAEHRANMSAARLGKKRGPYSDKARANMKAAQIRMKVRREEEIWRSVDV
jgi:hypothetical protein